MGRKLVCAAKIFFLLLLALAAGVWLNGVLNTNVRSYLTTDTGESEGSRILFFGTSQGANGINPLFLWDVAGIEAYNFCAPGQYIGTTYYVMEDVLSRRRPQAAVLDIRSLTKPEDFLTISNKLYSLPMIADPLRRFSMYRDVIAEEWAYVIPLFRYHNRWKEIGRADFEQSYTVLGCVGEHHVQTEQTALPEIAEQEAQPIGERELAYLERIAALTQEAGVPLVLLDMPCYTDEETEAKTQWVREWAAGRGIAFCEANRPQAYGGMGLMPEDFYDGNHLNLRGQEKVSSWLGLWLAEEFDLADARGTEAGDRWEEKIRLARQVQNDRELAIRTDAEGIFSLLLSGDYTVAVSLTGSYRDGGEAIRRGLLSLGMEEAAYEKGGAFVWKSGEGWLFSSDGRPEFLWTCSPGRDELAVRGTGALGEDGLWQTQAELLMDRQNREKTENGVNLLIYSNSQERLLKTIGFDAADGWRPLS